jgi:hypothetical protein
MQQNVQQILMRGLAVALCAAVLAGPAAAAPDDGPDALDARAIAARALFRTEYAVDATPSPARRQAAPATAAGSAELAAQRGGTDTRNDMRLDGTVGANTAINVATGSNVIDAGSFANMAGIPVVIQNSGANVLIQSATIINLQFK